MVRSKMDYIVFLSIKEIVEKDLEHLFISARSPQFFYKIDSSSISLTLVRFQLDQKITHL